jgi:predicted O-methyltransferase YrrM
MSTTATQPTLAQQILAALHPTNPYDGFDAHERDPAPPATNRDPYLPIIAQTKPRLAIEVGAWKGASSVVFARALREANPDACLVCVDTWLGSIEHFTNPPSPQWDLRPTLVHGYPTLYHHWLTTIIRHDVHDTVVPLANTSVTAAKWFARTNVRPEFIFIDAGHDEDDVTIDLNVWYPLLAPGAIMAGDDWSPMWPGVEAAVTKFCAPRNLKPQIVGPNWMIQKPAD